MKCALVELLLAGCFLIVGCTTSADAPAVSGGGPGEESGVGWVGPALYAQPVVRFNQNLVTGEATAYLPATHAACQAEPGRVFHYHLESLYRFEPDPRSPKAPGRWQPVETRSRAVSIGCDQSLPLSVLTGGVDLGLGTYWAASSLDGEPDFSFVYVGRMTCNDVALAGPRPAGSIALCVLHERHGAARFVPEPPRWNLVSPENGAD